MQRTTPQSALRRRRAAKPVRSSRRALVKLVAAYVLVMGGLYVGFRLADSAIAEQVGQGASSAAAESNSAAFDAPAAYDGPSNIDDWNLMLVNPKNALPAGYQATLASLGNGQAVDERCLASLQTMMDDCRTAGLEPLICSSYRTAEKQQALYDEQAGKLELQGLSTAEARTKAGTSVAVPGTSEHQLGLAVDIVDADNQLLDESQERMPVQQWLMANSWRYGFVLRYPSDKGDITGIIYEPWHYRYVGIDAAREMRERGMCLEEYRDLVAK